MIDDRGRTQIKQLLSSPQWRIVEEIADGLCQKIRDEGVIRESEWETIRSLLTSEGEVRGIRRFLQELYSQASKL